MDVNNFNKITNKFDLSQDLVIDKSDLQQVREQIKTLNSMGTINTINTIDSNEPTQINQDNIVGDFNYIRDLLKNSTTQTNLLLDGLKDDIEICEDKIGLINAYANLHKAHSEGIKLFLLAYKELSSTLINIKKVNNNVEEQETNKITIGSILKNIKNKENV